MADHAGFAVALTLRERLLNDAVLLAYADGRFPRALAFALPDGPPDARVDVFLAAPEVTCSAGNFLSIALVFWGSLSVTVNNVAQVRNVKGRLRVRLEPRFSVSGSQLLLSPNPEEVTVTNWDFSVLAGGAFPPDSELYLESSFFRSRLEHAVRLAIGIGVIKLPSVNIAFLGSVLNVVSTAASARVRQGVVLIGLSIESDPLTLVGDADLLQEFARNNDLAAVTHKDAVPAVLQDVETQVRGKVTQAGASLDHLTLRAGNGRFLVEGAASKTGATASFSFSLVLALFHTRPGVQFHYLPKPRHVNSRTWASLEFSIADVAVSIDKAWWLNLIEVAVAVPTLFYVPFYIEGMVSSTADGLSTSIANASTGPRVPRVRRLEPGKPGGPKVRVEIAEYEITVLGLYIGITTRIEAPPGLLLGPATIPADFRGQTLLYAVRLPVGVHAEDPALRVRWSVLDLDSGTVLLNDDSLALGRLTFSFVPQNVGPGLDRLGVVCRVYRTLGPEVEEVVNDGIPLQIRGPLLPGAYVRWRYDVKNPQVHLDEENDTYAYVGESTVRRWSNLHRTDAPCQMAAKISRFVYQLDTLDTLPFALHTILNHRAELCDYCFYGGPAGLRPSL